MIAPADYPILRAFLHRESKMYNWSLTGEKGRRAFVRRMFKDIVNHGDPSTGYDYIHIQSISNIGLLMSELVLSANHLDVLNGRMKCLLPPSPRGNIGFHHEEKK